MTSWVFSNHKEKEEKRKEEKRKKIDRKGFSTTAHTEYKD